MVAKPVSRLTATALRLLTALTGCADSTEPRPVGAAPGSSALASEGATVALGPPAVLESAATPRKAAQQFARALARGEAKAACGLADARFRAAPLRGTCGKNMAAVAVDDRCVFARPACVNSPTGYEERPETGLSRDRMAKDVSPVSSTSSPSCPQPHLAGTFPARGRHGEATDMAATRMTSSTEAARTQPVLPPVPVRLTDGAALAVTRALGELVAGLPQEPVPHVLSVYGARTATNRTRPPWPAPSHDPAWPTRPPGPASWGAWRADAGRCGEGLASTLNATVAGAASASLARGTTNAAGSAAVASRRALRVS